MGFIGKMVDKIKGNKKELTQSEIAEKKVEDLGNLLSKLNQKSFVKRVRSTNRKKFSKFKTKSKE